MDDLTREDKEQLSRQGIPEDEARDQLALLRDPPAPTRVDRPCVPGDGVHRVPDGRHAELIRRFEDAASAGRWTKFVPASGAASRMFKDLAAWLEAEKTGEAHEPPDAAQHLLKGGRRFAFWDDLLEAVERRGGDPGDPADCVSALLEEEGLDFARQPKGLIPFHRTGGATRTAFEEHLYEAVVYVRDRSGVARSSFTVPPEHREGFARQLERTRKNLRVLGQGELEVSLTVQDPGTDTLAIDTEGKPFRLSSGELLLRPGGHGALLRNLQELRGDLVLIKNIDNVLPESRRAHMVQWKKVLGGYLVELGGQIVAWLESLESAGSGGSVNWKKAVEFVRTRLGVDLSKKLADAADDRERAGILRGRLDRPLRVCGVVKNEGEPGGGPFWARDTDGLLSPQIVEASQIDLTDPGQKKVLEQSTHFNPVDIACALSDAGGRPYDLSPYIDRSTYFVAKKFAEGRELRALERPGLWNGAMSGWNTVFLEVPAETFAPVKTVFDLLRPEHQGDE